MHKRTIAILLCFFAAAAAFGQQPAESDQQSIFDGTLADAIWTVIAFVVLLAVLSKIAWKPLLKTLQSREDQIKHQLDSAENTRLKAEKLLDEYKKQSLEIIEKATHRANQIEKDTIENAGKEVMMMKEQAISEIGSAQNTARKQLWLQVGEILLNVNKEVLGHSITTSDDKRLVDEAIAKLKHQQLSGTQK